MACRVVRSGMPVVPLALASDQNRALRAVDIVELDATGPRARADQGGR